MLVEEVDVQGVEMLEVVVALAIPRVVLPIDEVVVQGEGHGPEAAGEKLDGEPLGEGGLARRRRTGDEDDAHVLLLLADLVGDLGDLLLVERLGHLDEVADPILANHRIEAPHVVHLEDLSPLLALVIGAEELLEPRGFGVDLSVPAIGKAEDEAVVVGLELELTGQAGGGSEGTVADVGEAPAGVEGELVPVAALEEMDLVEEASLPIEGDGLLLGHDPPLDGIVGVDDGLHAGADALEHALGHGDVRVVVVVVARSQAVADDEAGVVADLHDGPHEDHVDGGAIDLLPLPILVGHELDLAVEVEGVLEAMELVVHLGHEDGKTGILLVSVEDVENGGILLDLADGPVGHGDANHFGHGRFFLRSSFFHGKGASLADPTGKSILEAPLRAGPPTAAHLLFFFSFLLFFSPALPQKTCSENAAGLR